MDRTLDEVYEESHSLDAESKIILAERLLSESAPEEGHAEAWNKEINHRVEDIRLGHIQTFDAFEIINETKKSLGM
jgi:hypothetical protein